MNGFTFVGGVRFPDCGVNIGVGVKLIGDGKIGEAGAIGIGGAGGVKIGIALGVTGCAMTGAMDPGEKEMGEAGDVGEVIGGVAGKMGRSAGVGTCPPFILSM